VVKLQRELFEVNLLKTFNFKIISDFSKSLNILLLYTWPPFSSHVILLSGILSFLKKCLNIELQ